MNLPFTLTPLRLILAAAGVIVFIGVIVWGVNSYQARKYDKDRQKYQASETAMKAERDQLSGENKVLKSQIASLEPQLLAYKSAQEVGKKVDDGLAKKIEDVGKESANAEANAQMPSTCNDRAQRVCDMFRASDKRFDCRAIFAECSR